MSTDGDSSLDGTRGESALHRELKSAVADHFRHRGCTVALEAGAGGARADVLVDLVDGPLAIEAQLSPQGAADTLERTARYAAGGIKTVWLMRTRPRALPPEVPAFTMPFLGSPWRVLIDGDLERTEGRMVVPLSEVLDAIVEQRLSWRVAPTVSRTMLEVSAFVMRCWSCHRLVWAIEAEAAGRCGCGRRLATAHRSDHEWVAQALASRRSEITDATSDDLPIADIERRESKTTGRATWANICPDPGCAALFGEWFMRDDWLEAASGDSLLRLYRPLPEAELGAWPRLDAIAHWCLQPRAAQEARRTQSRDDAS